MPQDFAFPKEFVEQVAADPEVMRKLADLALLKEAIGSAADGHHPVTIITAMGLLAVDVLAQSEEIFHDEPDVLRVLLQMALTQAEELASTARTRLADLGI